MDEAARRIIEWGAEHSVEFPWREPPSPYHSAVAEILLIRTPPQQALPVYREFTSAYPTVHDLAQAPEEEIAGVISSLGLRWRTERLSSMAEYIVRQQHGEFPDTVQGLQKVPGIGFYGASAITLFAYGKRAFLVDANSVRFIVRYQGRSFSGEARRNKKLIAAMDELTPDDDEKAVAFAEGFLDFMREVCRPSNPACDRCTLRQACAHREATQVSGGDEGG